VTPEAEAVLAELRPYPEDGSRADGPVAVDATDRLLLDEAAPLIADDPEGVVVIGDRFGALTFGALALGADNVRVHQDAITAEAALEANASRVSTALWAAHERVAANATVPGATAQPSLTGYDLVEPNLLRGARLVLLQLPTSLAELTEIAEHVARHADPAVTLLAGGRVKHMTHAMNDVLRASFTQVSASLARQKSRLLIAREPRPDVGPLTCPVAARLTDREILDAMGTAGKAPDAGLTVVAHGAAFAGAALDLGTRFLLAQADRWPDLSYAPAHAEPSPHGPDYMDERPIAVDLGCGTGILATVLALRFPGAHVVATDRSSAACASARATLAANGVRAAVVRGDAGDSLPFPDGTADLVLLNPPFHDRAALSKDAAHRMFAAAGKMLRDGGELWTVFNTSLHYRPALERAVGPTEHIAQDPKFTVTRSVRKVLTDGSVRGG
jgi:16S rRNA (guanine1207-N2)-methyltransferase